MDSVEGRVLADDSYRDMPENTKLENIYRGENKLLRRQYRMHKRTGCLGAPGQ